MAFRRKAGAALCMVLSVLAAACYVFVIRGRWAAGLSPATHIDTLLITMSGLLAARLLWRGANLKQITGMLLLVQGVVMLSNVASLLIPPAVAPKESTLPLGLVLTFSTPYALGSLVVCRYGWKLWSGEELWEVQRLFLMTLVLLGVGPDPVRLNSFLRLLPVLYPKAVSTPEHIRLLVIGAYSSGCFWLLWREGEWGWSVGRFIGTGALAAALSLALVALMPLAAAAQQEIGRADSYEIAAFLGILSACCGGVGWSLWRGVRASTVGALISYGFSVILFAFAISFVVVADIGPAVLLLVPALILLHYGRLLHSASKRASTDPIADRYVTGGTVSPDDPSYVERQADHSLYEALQRSQFCYVLTSRQTGKSSLMARTMNRLRQEGVAAVSVDLSAFGGYDGTMGQWYFDMLDVIGSKLDLGDELDDFWCGHEHLGLLHRWMAAIRRVILPHCPRGLVLFIDEVDKVRSLPFSTAEFFAAIRACYNNRIEEPELQRLTYCLVGVATPADLIRDPRITPFNIGRRIELTDFSESEAAPLAQGLNRKAASGHRLLRRVLYWTGGHPYLTQALCKTVADDKSVKGDVGVDRVFRSLFLHRGVKPAEEVQSLTQLREEVKGHLVDVETRLLASGVALSELLHLYQQVHRGERVPVNPTDQRVDILRLAGLIRLEEGLLQVRNRVYARVFDQRWISANVSGAKQQREWVALFRQPLRTVGIAGVTICLLIALWGYQHVVSELRVQQYVNRMQQAHRAWMEQNIPRTNELLEAERPKGERDDLRGFEWYYLRQLCPSTSAPPQRASDDRTSGLAFSPDGRLLAYGSKDDSDIHLWDIKNKREIRGLKGRGGQVLDVAFSANHELLASASKDGTARLWDLRTRRELAVLPGPQHVAETGRTFSPYSRAVAFSPDSRLLAYGGNHLSIWDVATRRNVASRPQGLKNGLTFHPLIDIQQLAFSPTGTKLAVSTGSSLEIWGVSPLKTTVSLPGSSSVAAFLPDGRRLVAGGDRGILTVWDTELRRALWYLPTQPGAIQSLAVSADGMYMASGTVDNAVNLWSLSSSKPVAVKQGTEVAFSHDSRWLAFLQPNRKPGFVPIPPPTTAAREDNWVRSVAFAFSRDRLLFAAAHNSGTIDIEERKATDSNKKTRTRSLNAKNRVKSLAFSPDGKLLAAGGDSLSMWDTATWEPSAGLPDAATGAGGVGFSADGRRLAFTIDGSRPDAPDGIVGLWDLTRRDKMDTIGRRSGRSKRLLAISPDGHTLAIADDAVIKPTVRLWDMEARREVSVLHERRNTSSTHGQESPPTTMAFSPNGRILATGYHNGAVRLWDLTRVIGDPTVLRAHTSPVEGLAFSPDERTLATAGTDVGIKLWNVHTWEEMMSIRAPCHSLCVAFSPDGYLLVTGGDNRQSYAFSGADPGPSGGRGLR